MARTRCSLKYAMFWATIDEMVGNVAFCILFETGFGREARNFGALRWIRVRVSVRVRVRPGIKCAGSVVVCCNAGHRVSWYFVKSALSNGLVHHEPTW